MSEAGSDRVIKPWKRNTQPLRSTTSAAAGVAPTLAFRARITYLIGMPDSYSAQLVSIEGDDVLAFAQSQFSSNVLELAEGHWHFSAWLDPQGRVRALFHLLRRSNKQLQLLLRGGDAAPMVAALQRYVFRAKVRISALPVRALACGAALPMHVIAEDDGAIALGCDSHSLRVDAVSDDAWRLLQLRAGWPWLPDATLGELLAASLSLQSLGATALDKGCYPGQEIVARLHYRGGHKRHLHHLHLSHAVPPGTVLREGTGELVQLLDVVSIDDGAEALAVMSDATAQRMPGTLAMQDEDTHVSARIVQHASCTSPAQT